MLKHVVKGTGLAIGASLLSVGQAFAGNFSIDSFNNQFTIPYTSSQSQSIATAPVLNTGTRYPTSASSPAYLNDPSGLPTNQVIGGARNMNIYSVQNTNNLTASGSTRVTTSSGVGFWQVASSNGSRVSSSMIWNNIDPLAPATARNSGKFKDRLHLGGLAFKTLGVTTGSTNPLFQPIFTMTVKDAAGVSSSVSKTGIGSNQFVLINFFEFQAAAASINLNAVNYVELNVTTGGGSSSTVRVDYVQGYEIPEPSLVLGSLVVFGVGYLSTRGRSLRPEDN